MVLRSSIKNIPTFKEKSMEIYFICYESKCSAIKVSEGLASLGALGIDLPHVDFSLLVFLCVIFFSMYISPFSLSYGELEHTQRTSL